MFITYIKNIHIYNTKNIQIKRYALILYFTSIYIYLILFKLAILSKKNSFNRRKIHIQRNFDLLSMDRYHSPRERELIPSIVSGEIYRLLGGPCSTHLDRIRYRSKIVYNTVSMLLHCAAAFHASEGLFKSVSPFSSVSFRTFGPRILIRYPFKWKLMPR